MVDLALFGGCLTTNALYRFRDPGLNIVVKIARTSMISQMSAPIAVDLDAAPGLVRTERRWMEIEFSRTALAVLEGGLDFLVIDLGEETTTLLRIAERYATFTSTLRKHRLHDQLTVDATLRRDDPAVTALWKASCDRFCEGLLARLAPDRIIVHRTLLAQAYRDGSETRPMTGGPAAYAAKLNPILETYHDHLVSRLAGAWVIDVPPALRLADPHHRLGLGGLHYVEDYDRAFMAQLTAVVHIGGRNT